ncbi:glycosyltransferase [Candidatus Woesearchaeota archaeon]|nr:glycosyltransferase [Candidatus Woesearchaeota archaeon]
MISIVVTSFKEPLLVKRAVNAILKNNIKEKYELIVASPDIETEKIVEELSKANKNIKFFKDGKGKTFALNLVFKILKGNIWVFTDGNVFVGENSINEILSQFSDEMVGCVAGKPVSVNSRSNMLGYWSHLLFDAGAHKIRQDLSKKGKFLECSGYLFAFRDNITKNVPLNVAPDTIIPYLVMKKGYKVRYAENALVYVTNPSNLGDFLKQKIEHAKSHESLNEYAPFFPKVKSFRNEIKKGTVLALKYPSNLKEYFWTFLLFFTRLYIWTKVKTDYIILKKKYSDSWRVN